MGIRLLTDPEVREMQRTVTTPPGLTSLRWHEGVELVGYWSAGDSYVFESIDGHHLCLSASYIRWLLEDDAA